MCVEASLPIHSSLQPPVSPLTAFSASLFLISFNPSSSKSTKVANIGREGARRWISALLGFRFHSWNISSQMAMLVPGVDVKLGFHTHFLKGCWLRYGGISSRFSTSLHAMPRRLSSMNRRTSGMEHLSNPTWSTCATEVHQKRDNMAIHARNAGKGYFPSTTEPLGSSIVSHASASNPSSPRSLNFRTQTSITETTEGRTSPISSTTNSDDPLLAFDLIQGALVRWSTEDVRRARMPPTAVLLHGILGSRKNWASFAKRLAQEFPSWQFLLVDLRCHGDSSQFQRPGPHTVATAAMDVLKLVTNLRIVPRVLIGHSFGGKVALSMAEQAAKPLPCPIQVWVLDATPGKVRAGGDGEDHPAELITALQNMPSKISDRRSIISSLCSQGFSKPVAQWMTTNLRIERPPLSPSPSPTPPSSYFSWAFDLDGISEMYQSYEATNLWPLVESVPEGLHINFLRAERSLHRWAHEDTSRISAAEFIASNGGASVQMHVLEDAGHWVHTDNPDGLFQILTPSFGGRGFLH